METNDKIIILEIMSKNGNCWFKESESDAHVSLSHENGILTPHSQIW